MRKAALLFSIIVLLCLVTACKHGAESSNSPVNSNSNTESSMSNKGSKDDPQSYDWDGINLPKGSMIYALYPISSECYYVVYKIDDKYYLCVYDVNTDTIKKQAVISELGFDINSVKSYMQGKNLCIASTETKLSGSDKEQRSDSEVEDQTVIFTVWDSSLNKLVKIDVSKVVPMGLTPFCINFKLDRIAYEKYIDGRYTVCVNDLDLQNPRYPIKFGNESVPGNFSALAYINDTTLAFTGEQRKTKVFGTIDQDGNINLQKHDGISNNICTSLNSTLFSDEHTMYGVLSSGTVYIADNKTGAISAFQVTDKNESQNAFLSDYGNYLITYLEGVQQNDNMIYRFRIYDIKTKKLVKEFDVPMDIPLGGVTISSLYGSEEFNTLTLVYRIETKSRIEQYALK